jgi:hypothetical protein
MISKFVKKIVIFGWVISGLSLLIFLADRYLYPHPYTQEQCKYVAKNFHKLNVGMSKKEVTPLIGGERKSMPTGRFQKQKDRWAIWALCKNPKNEREWLMIAFDPKTDKVVKIFSGNPETYGFE